ncbi:ATP-dependent helicase [Demequina soli]|uniref:ATP-dependent helicase n=1 Tax=Demequina soli TaxID=1638987 RepID=UPI000782F20B|nr:ATP-dependent DNA helicase [Demequina soli]
MKFTWVPQPESAKPRAPKPFVAPAPTQPPAPPIVPRPAPAVPTTRPDAPPRTSRPAPLKPVAIPVLEGDAKAAVEHRGSHIQIVAAAGSGKTEVVSQRVAALLVDGERPEAIVAFTFTEKAASELKERIRERVTALKGPEASDELGRLFVGTIHAYCFRMLQQYVPRFETFTPLDQNQLTNLLYREAYGLGIKALNPDKGLFANIETFARGIDVLENELVGLDELPADAFTETAREYYDMLDRYQVMSFGTQIVHAVRALEDPKIHEAVAADLRHLIVDEYQDVNPAQERLISLLAKPHGSADVVVVGDDDQAIYQWRGSAVENILTFQARYPGVERFELLQNRRSRPGVVDLANRFAHSIPGRFDKEMSAAREADGPSVAIARDTGTESDEADAIAQQIATFYAQGLPYRDIAILVRGKAAYPALLAALENHRIPVQPGGRTGLFAQPEAAALGKAYAWLASIEWKVGKWGQREDVSLEDVVDALAESFDLAAPTRAVLTDHLTTWQGRALASEFNESLVRDYYALIALLGVRDWDLTDAYTRNRIGTVARFTQVLADYEGVSWRARRDPKNPGEQVGGQSGGEWFYKNFAILLANYASGSYDAFEGMDASVDGVSLGTIHGSKGLEWPVVFLPSLVKGRFPSSRMGAAQEWPSVLEGRFDAARYEGVDADERRLFYVAVTRSRDALLLSAHSRQKNGHRKGPSPYFEEAEGLLASPGTPTTVVAKPPKSEGELALTFSELAAYESCPRGYLLKNELGFMPPIQQELGYGNAVHHTMRVVAEATMATGTVPTLVEVDQLIDSEFYLPYANKPAHKEMREAARRLVHRYVTEHSDDLAKTWATERPFELYLDGVVVAGRADVIYDDAGSLAIVDYKTSVGGGIEPLQLQVYADAGRREGLDVSAAYIHDLGTARRHTVDVGMPAIGVAESQVIATVGRLREGDYDPRPEVAKCRTCDVKTICKAARLR